MPPQLLSGANPTAGWSDLHCVVKASECAEARERWRVTTQKYRKDTHAKQSFARWRARAPKGNRLRAAGARGEPILTSKAIRQGAENAAERTAGQRKRARRARGR